MTLMQTMTQGQMLTRLVIGLTVFVVGQWLLWKPLRPRNGETIKSPRAIAGLVAGFASLMGLAYAVGGILIRYGLN